MIDRQLELLDDQIAFLGAVLDTLPAHIAILDSQGTILAVNQGWRSFGSANGLTSDAYCVGANYLRACNSAKLDPDVRTIIEGIRAILAGASTSFYFEYPCHSPAVERWFKMRATPVPGYPHFAVVAHEDITERVLIERSHPTANQIAEQKRGEEVHRHQRRPEVDTAQTLVQPQLSSLADKRTESLRILLVDDNDDVRTIIEGMLSSLGHVVIPMADSELALSMFDEHKPDVLITDLLMPGRLGGAELAKAVHDRLPSLPILIISGYADAADLDFPLLAKPFRMQDLDAVLRRLRSSPSES